MPDTERRHPRTPRSSRSIGLRLALLGCCPVQAETWRDTSTDPFAYCAAVVGAIREVSGSVFRPP